MTNAGAYGTGTIRAFTKDDRHEVNRKFQQSVDSFRFLK
jgi:hypothetical protein